MLHCERGNWSERGQAYIAALMRKRGKCDSPSNPPIQRGRILVFAQGPDAGGRSRGACARFGLRFSDRDRDDAGNGQTAQDGANGRCRSFCRRVERRAVRAYSSGPHRQLHSCSSDRPEPCRSHHSNPFVQPVRDPAAVCPLGARKRIHIQWIVRVLAERWPFRAATPRPA